MDKEKELIQPFIAHLLKDQDFISSVEDLHSLDHKTTLLEILSIKKQSKINKPQKIKSN